MCARLAAGWRTVRGEDAYARYLRHATCTHADRPPMSRKEFFKAEQARRWDGVRRCC
ncbi:MAG: YbdD/YjiX family protein [Gammaproteobacteria bacterium]|nr:YbdD/YjiX family protein [Gammaproteobacteria bacterium]